MRVGTDISDWIITPIENYLSGRSQDAVFDLYYQGLTFQNIARDHREDELAMAIRPYVRVTRCQARCYERWEK